MFYNKHVRPLEMEQINLEPVVTVVADLPACCAKIGKYYTTGRHCLKNLGY